MKRQIDALLQSLLLIRIGQELGTDSQTAQLIHEWISFFLAAARFWP
jgi:hypothetical protein